MKDCHLERSRKAKSKDLYSSCQLFFQQKRISVKAQRFFIPFRYIQNDTSRRRRTSLGNAELHDRKVTSHAAGVLHTEGTSLGNAELHDRKVTSHAIRRTSLSPSFRLNVQRVPEKFWNKNFWERGETDGQGLRANTCSPLPDGRVSTKAYFTWHRRTSRRRHSTLHSANYKPTVRLS